MKKLVIALMGFSVLSHGVGAQSGASYYVSLSGSDGRSCSEAQSLSTPKRSVAAGVACLRAGDTLYVRGGTYPEALVSLQFTSGSAWSSKVRIAAYGSETVWLKPAAGPGWIIQFDRGQQYIEFDGINLDTTNATSTQRMGGIWVNSDAGPNSHHIRFKNFTVIGNRHPGDHSSSAINITFFGSTPDRSGNNEVLNCRVYGSGGNNSMYGFYIHSSNNLVEGCNIYDVGQTGIQVYNGRGRPTGNILRNNRIHDIIKSYNAQRIGIQVVGDNTLIANNVVYRLNYDGAASAADVVGISVKGSGNKVFNNTVAHNNGRNIDLGSPATNTEIVNNIGYGNSSNGITNYGSTGSMVATNLFGVDAKFVNASSGDFQLQSGSPALDAGTALSSTVTTDIIGAARPQGNSYDIGAYEYPGTSTSAQGPPQPPNGVRIVQ